MDRKIIEKIERGKVFAIIPARSGSKGVKDKNIREINGYPILAYAIAAAKLSKKIDRVIVSTDSPKYAEVAKKFGAEAPFLRPPEISGDNATDIEFMEHAIEWFYHNENSVPEYWVHLRPTTPLRRYEIVDDAIRRFLSDPDAESLRSAHLTEACPFKWFVMDEKGYYKTFNGLSFDEANRPRQSFPPVYIPDGYVDVLRTEHIVHCGNLHGDNMIAFQSPEAVDVDSMKDLEALEKAVKEYQSELLEYLRNIEKEG